MVQDDEALAIGKTLSVLLKQWRKLYREDHQVFFWVALVVGAVVVSAAEFVLELVGVWGDVLELEEAKFVVLLLLFDWA